MSDETARTAEAETAIRELEGTARDAARSIDDAFAQAGEGVARSLARAAADGKVTLAELARAVIAAVNAGAGSGGESGSGGLAAAIEAAVGSVFRGARAAGGPVAGGGAYLVGERGPEVFRPGASGSVEPLGGGGTTVNVTVAGEGGGAGLHRSEAQIAGALARAVALGLRR